MRSMFRPALETLEGREVPAASLAASGVLTVAGTAAADQIILREFPGSNLTTVTVNGVQQNFLSSRVTRIDVFGYGGNDLIDASGIISDPVRLFGGNGNDRLIGGGQNDALYGENNNDVLIGGPGNDLLSGGYGVDTFYHGPYDRPIVDVGVRALGFDATDGPALAKPTYRIAAGAPQQVTTASSLQPGQRTLGGILAYTPAYAQGTVYSITVEGNFSGGTNFQVTRSMPNQTHDAGIPVPVSVRVNADGSRTLTFLTPFTMPQQSATMFEVRAVLGSSGLPLDVRIRDIEVAGPAINVEYKFQIRWNV